MKNNKLLGVVLGILFIGLIGYFINAGIFKQSSILQTENKLRVTTSFYPLYYFANQIGGEKINVTNITPAGTEPHDYQPTPRQIVQIERSRVFILNSGGFDTWAERMQESLSGKNIAVLAVSEGLRSLNYTDEKGKKVTDPHIWLSPVQAQKEAQKIKDILIKSDPQNRQVYEANAEVLNQKFVQLDRKFREGLSLCSQKSFITSHAAFGYLAKEYGLTQVSISGLSPEQVPSSSRMAEITQFARENNVKYIFFESLVSPKLSETIANEIGAKTLVLDPIEGISEEGIKQGKSYFTVMEDNLKNLQTALQCSK